MLDCCQLFCIFPLILFFLPTSEKIKESKVNLKELRIAISAYMFPLFSTFVPLMQKPMFFKSFFVLSTDWMCCCDDFWCGQWSLQITIIIEKFCHLMSLNIQMLISPKRLVEKCYTEQNLSQIGWFKNEKKGQFVSIFFIS